jgi:hypothetical protein
MSDTLIPEKVHSMGVRLGGLLSYKTEEMTVSDILAFVTAAFVMGVVAGVALMRMGLVS